ncbi:MAG: hypothetical protein H7X88_07525 [Gloeobacteraceae cyanobacterium ES-bin-316]|nr:hypothetical protein [Ferruginibacter sp.]
MAFLICGLNFHLGKSYPVENYCCPYCDYYDSTELFLVSNYFHVFYIPYLPTDKSGSAICSSCKKVILEVNFSKKLLAVFKEEKKNYRHPLKMYTGFIMFPGFIMAAVLIGYVWENMIK